MSRSRLTLSLVVATATILAMTWIGLLAASPEPAAAPGAVPSAAAPILTDLPIPESINVCGIELPSHRLDLREAIAYELILTVGKPTMPTLWMRREPGAMPGIEAMLRERGLPDDLKYVAVIESDLRLTAKSPAQAVGLWQFVESSGRRYGLRIDRYIDERMSPEASTRAAVRMFSELHAKYRDWPLVLAAYNAGEGTIDQAIGDQGKRDYFDMYLPYETRRYLPRLIAAKLVLEQPERYGLKRSVPLFTPSYRSIEIQIKSGPADLRKLAKERQLDYAALRLANPQLLGPLLPAGTFHLRSPLNGINESASAEAGSGG